MCEKSLRRDGVDFLEDQTAISREMVVTDSLPPTDTDTLYFPLDIFTLET